MSVDIYPYLYIYISARCQAQNNQKYCKSVQGDCRHIQGACPPEQCVYQEKLNKYLKVDIYNQLGCSIRSSFDIVLPPVPRVRVS